MAKKQPNLGALELEVLKTTWLHQPCTVQEMTKFLSKRRGYARTTVLTVMQRLHAKGFLKRRKVHGAFQYSPTEGRNKVMSQLIGQFFNKVTDGSALPFVTYLTETKALNKKQITVLREIVQELEKKEGESK